jgi:hypothetical protein
VQLDPDGNPVAVMELTEGQWQLADLEEYWNVANDLVFGASDGYGTGHEWSSEEFNFSVDALSDPLDPPSAEEAEDVYNLFILHLIAEDEIEDNEEVAIAFCYRPEDE